jgi:uncharacterized membrane protein YcaP (DUF421 family)
METVIRVVAIYLFLMVALRVMGKREFSQMAPFELVTLLMIPELVAQALVREDFSLTNAVVAVCTLLTMVLLTSILAFRSRTLGKIIEGEPAVLVQHGLLVPGNMALERIPPEEVVSAMHNAGLERLAQIKWAVLETDGKISVVAWPSESERRAQEEKKLV